MADTCVGVGVPCCFGYVCLSSDAHGFDDVANLLIESVFFIDMMQVCLNVFGEQGDAPTVLAGLHLPLSMWRVCCGADAMVEQISAERFEPTPPMFGSFKMLDVGKNRIAQLQRGIGDGVMLGCLPIFPYI